MSAEKQKNKRNKKIWLAIAFAVFVALVIFFFCYLKWQRINAGGKPSVTDSKTFSFVMLRNVYILETIHYLGFSNELLGIFQERLGVLTARSASCIA